jgi:hypothetical protein
MFGAEGDDRRRAAREDHGVATVERPRHHPAATKPVPEFYRLVNERICELGWFDSGGYAFVCEYDDASCARAMRMQAWEFDAVRSAKKLFVLLPGHERAGRDEQLVRTEQFVIVRMLERN